MYVGILFVIFLILLVLSMPVAFAMAAAGGFSLMAEGVDLIGAVPRIFSGMNSMSLLAIPFFLLSGSLMEYGGISKQLVAFAKSLVGHLTGGLAHVCVLSSMIFASVSGSSVASAMAFGNILVPAMNKGGYDKGFTSTIQACGGTLGPIIPPSIVMIMYCSITGISVGAMFMAGFIPGILIGVGLMIVSYFYAKKAGIPKEGKLPASEVWKSFKGAVWALFMPVIIVGGILSGLFTATESGMIAVVYGIFIGKVIYKELKWKDLPRGAAALIMVFAMLPGLLLALYERHGQPLEVVVWQIIQCCFLMPKERPYQTNNAYSALVRQRQMEKEVNAIVQKAKERSAGKKAGKADPRRKERDSGRHPQV